MKTIIIKMLPEVLNFIGFNAISLGSHLNKVPVKEIEITFDVIEVDKTTINLERNLKHLELIHYLEGSNLGDHAKYFSPLFLSELKNLKYEAQMNIINTSRHIMKHTG